MNDRWDRRYRTVLIILVVISLALVTLTFRGGASGVAAATRRAILTITTPFVKAFSWVGSPFVGTWRFMGSLGSLSRENEALQGEVGQLRQEAARVRELEVENETLRRLTGMRPQPPGQTRVASVVGYVPGGWERGLIIDLGRSEGVKIGAPVVVDGGVVGQVVRASVIGAEVRLITDPRGGTGALVQETRDVGVTEGSVTGDLYLRYIKRESGVKKGDTIVTSGLGGAYPKGLYIGNVKAVDDPGTGLYKDIAIRSKVDFRRLEKVLVLIDYPVPIARFRRGA